MKCRHRHVLKGTSANSWAKAKLQCRHEREREQRCFQLNALAARTATLWTMVRVWRSRDKAGYKWPWPVTVRQLDVCWLQVRTSHDHSYIAGIPLLAHSLTVKLSPCPYSHNSPAGRIAACLWAFQNEICYSLRLAPGWFSIFLVNYVLYHGLMSVECPQATYDAVSSRAGLIPAV